MSDDLSREDFQHELGSLFSDIEARFAALDEREQKAFDEYRAILAGLHLKNLLSPSHD